MAQQGGHIPGPPYFPPVALPGLRPTVSTDVPITAVFLALYIGSAIGHMTLMQMNKRKGHKFLISGFLFGFGMARTTTCVLRIAWATRPNNVRLSIAALIVTNAGVLIIYGVNLALAQRIFRATHPELGWNKVLSKFMLGWYGLLVFAISLVIAFVVVSFYTLDPKLQLAATWSQRTGILILFLFNLVGPTLLVLSVFLPKAPNAENFGRGSIRSKEIILAIAMFFTLFIAGFRTGVSLSPSHLISDAPWYDGRGPFYGIELAFELIITYFYLFTRIDRRFWIPDGSCKPGDLSSASSPLDMQRGGSHEKALAHTDSSDPETGSVKS